MENLLNLLSAAHSGFRLMDLPGEMRNNIYRHYFDSFDINNIDTRLEKLQPCLNILHSNSQVRTEAVKIFYKEYVAPGPRDLPSAEYYDKIARWEIHTGSGSVMLRRLKAFSSSLKTFDVDISFCLSFDNELSLRTFRSNDSLSRDFVHAVWDHLNRDIWYPETFTDGPNGKDIFRLAGGQSSLDVAARDVTAWPGTQRQDRTVRGYRLRMKTANLPVYFLEYHIVDSQPGVDDGLIGRDETFKLRGKLARIDWSGFEFKFSKRTVSQEPNSRYEHIYSSMVDLTDGDRISGELVYCSYRLLRG